MGFDIYGLNPKLKSERPKIDWNNHTKAEADQYFKDVEKFEKENPGYYFRNNVCCFFVNSMTSIIMPTFSVFVA